MRFLKKCMSIMFQRAEREEKVYGIFFQRAIFLKFCVYYRSVTMVTIIIGQKLKKIAPKFASDIGFLTFLINNLKRTK